MVAPQRAAKDRSRKKDGMKNKKAKPAVSDKEWPPKDATIGATATPPEAKIVGSALEDNKQIDSIKESDPVCLSELVEKNMEIMTSEYLKKALKNLLKKSEQKS